MFAALATAFVAALEAVAAVVFAFALLALVMIILSALTD